MRAAVRQYPRILAGYFFFTADKRHRVSAQGLPMISDDEIEFLHPDVRREVPARHPAEPVPIFSEGSNQERREVLSL